MATETQTEGRIDVEMLEKNGWKNKLRRWMNGMVELNRAVVMKESEWVGKIPEWVPVVPGLLKQKVEEQKASFALGSGINPETGKKFGDWKERLHYVAGREVDAWGSSIGSAVELALVLGGGGGSSAGALAEKMAKVANGDVGVVVETAPRFVRWVAGKVPEGAGKVVMSVASGMETLVENPVTRGFVVERAKNWGPVKEAGKLWKSAEARAEASRRTVETLKQMFGPRQGSAPPSAA